MVGAATVPADYSAEVAPPAPVVEDQPPAPEAGETWVSGYWWWSVPLHRYVWVSGAWRHPPPDQYWSPGAWNLANGRYYWTPGYWGPHGYTRELIDVPPPPYRVEAYGVAPGVGFMWTPGYYAFRGGVYEWVSGSWLRPPGVGFGWIEPRYVTVGGRYYLQPGRWDYGPAHRGVVYRPDIDIHAGGHVNLAPVPQGLVAAHASFVTSSAHAQAHGGARVPGGATFHGGGAAPGGGEVHGGGNPRVVGEHVAPFGAGQVHGGPPPRVEPHLEPHNEVHFGGAPPPGRGGPAPGRGGPAQEQHYNPPVSHGPAPGKRH